MVEERETVRTYKYIKMVVYGTKHRRNKYAIVNKKSYKILGMVEYYKEWDEFVMSGVRCSSVFSESCLGNIRDFLQRLNSRENQK